MDIYPHFSLANLEIGLLIGIVIKLYALMTPPAVLSAFIAYTKGSSRRERNIIACKCALAIFIIGETLFLFGQPIFSVFGFTLDAFRIGVGLLLFLTAIKVMNAKPNTRPLPSDADISIVPLAMPLGMGPSSIGVVMVWGAACETMEDMVIGSFCLFCASVGMAALLWIARPVEKLIGTTGIAVLAKLTGLLLSAIAAQVVFTGIKGFIKP